MTSQCLTWSVRSQPRPSCRSGTWPGPAELFRRNDVPPASSRRCWCRCSRRRGSPPRRRDRPFAWKASRWNDFVVLWNVFPWILHGGVKWSGAKQMTSWYHIRLYIPIKSSWVSSAGTWLTSFFVKTSVQRPWNSGRCNRTCLWKMCERNLWLCIRPWKC